MEDYQVYLDESGDLGFSFQKTYRFGGSSRFLTIASIITPTKLTPQIIRLVKDFYTKYKISSKKEWKGSDFTHDQKNFLISKITKLLVKYEDINIKVITCRKERVQSHITSDPNKLYNYMINLSVLETIAPYNKEVKLIRDNRSIKVDSGNSCGDYLQTQLWFEYKSKTTLIDDPKESHTNKALIFIDWVTHILWEKYEDSSTLNLNPLLSRISNKELFF